MITVLALVFLMIAAMDPEPVSKWWIGFLVIVLIGSLDRKWR